MRRRSKYNDVFICRKCGNECFIEDIDGHFMCYCDNCNDYAIGFDADEHETDIHSQMIDRVYDEMMDARMEFNS